MIESIKTEMKEIESFSVESIGDIAHIMKNKIKLKQMRTLLIVIGVPSSLLFWISVVMWITMGVWWLFAVSAIVSAVFAVIASKCYFNSVAYICPHCHEVFKPTFKEILLAYHTPKMRRLTCPKCNHKGLCIEVYADNEIVNKDQN